MRTCQVIDSHRLLAIIQMLKPPATPAKVFAGYQITYAIYKRKPYHIKRYARYCGKRLHTSWGIAARSRARATAPESCEPPSPSGGIRRVEQRIGRSLKTAIDRRSESGVMC